MEGFDVGLALGTVDGSAVIGEGVGSDVEGSRGDCNDGEDDGREMVSESLGHVLQATGHLSSNSFTSSGENERTAKL